MIIISQVENLRIGEGLKEWEECAQGQEKPGRLTSLPSSSITVHIGEIDDICCVSGCLTSLVDGIHSSSGHRH